LADDRKDDHVESGQPIMEGFLEKERPRGLHSWQTRFFRLYPKTLQYFKNEKQKDERGIIELGSVRAIDEENVNDSIFEIKTNAKIKDTENRSYRLKAPSIPQRTVWVKTLADTIYKLMDEAKAREKDPSKDNNQPSETPKAMDEMGSPDSGNSKGSIAPNDNSIGGSGSGSGSGGSGSSSSGTSKDKMDKSENMNDNMTPNSNNNSNSSNNNNKNNIDDDSKPKKLVFTPTKPQISQTPKPPERSICRACSSDSCLIS